MLINKINQELVYKKTGGLIFLNFPENGKHGCNGQCEFCCWHKNNFNKYLCPTNEDIIDFCKLFPELRGIQLTGGGDPLYNYEENKTELHRIINCIKSLGFEVSLITREYRTLLDNYKEFSKVDRFYFSAENLDDDLRALAIQISADNKYCEITKVYNIEDNVTSDENMLAYVNYYKDTEAVLKFRENFHHKIDRTLFRQKQNFVQDTLKKIYCKVKLSKHNFLAIGLYGNEVWHSQDYDTMVDTGKF